MAHVVRTLLLTVLGLALSSVAGAQCTDYSDGGAGVTPVEHSFAPDGTANGFALVGDDLWVVRDIYGGLVCVDVSDPASPVEVGSVSLGDEAFEVAIEGNLACYTFLNWGGTAGIQIVDITDRTAPTLRGAITDRLAYGVAVSGGLAYMVGAYDGGVTIVDLADPDDPTILGSAPTPGTSLSVVLSGTRAYVGSDGHGITTVDISDPEAPSFAGYATIGGVIRNNVTVQQMQVVGSLLYAAASQSVDIYDLSDPDWPLLIGSSPTPGWARDIHVDGPMAWVADNTAGIHWMSVIDPEAPAIIASYPMSGHSTHIISKGGYVLVSKTSLFVLPDQCPVSATAAPVPGLARPSVRVSPNPFNPTTTIFMQSPQAGLAELSIFTLDGRLVRRLATDWRDAGAWSVPWDGRDDTGMSVASGTYVARMRVGDQSVATKMSCIK